jgi:IS1 family transposase
LNKNVKAETKHTFLFQHNRTQSFGNLISFCHQMKVGEVVPDAWCLLTDPAELANLNYKPTCEAYYDLCHDTAYPD